MFFLKRDQRIVGPVPASQINAGLKQGDLNENDLYSSSKAGPWKPLGTFSLSNQSGLASDSQAIKVVEKVTYRKALIGGKRFTVYKCPNCKGQLETECREMPNGDQCPDCNEQINFSASAKNYIREKIVAEQQKKAELESIKNKKREDQKQKKEKTLLARKKDSELKQKNALSLTKNQNLINRNSALGSDVMADREFPALLIVAKILIGLRNFIIFLWVITIIGGGFVGVYTLSQTDDGISLQGIFFLILSGLGLTLAYGFLALFYWATAEVIHLALYIAGLLEKILYANVSQRKQF